VLLINNIIIILCHPVHLQMLQSYILITNQRNHSLRTMNRNIIIIKMFYLMMTMKEPGFCKINHHLIYFLNTRMHFYCCIILIKIIYIYRFYLFGYMLFSPLIANKLRTRGRKNSVMMGFGLLTLINLFMFACPLIHDDK
jgi:hypothetical protein